MVKLRQCLLMGVWVAIASLAHAQSLPSIHLMDALSPEVLAKVDRVAMENLLASPNNKVIVLFAQPDASEFRTSTDERARREEKKRLFAQYKSDVLARLNQPGLPSVVLRRDYTFLPMALIETTSQQALLNLLHDAAVIRVYENEAYVTTLNESLPLINADVTAAQGYGGQGTSVAVLDTGVDYTLAVFGACDSPGQGAGCRVPVACDAKKCEQAPLSGERDSHGHGTNVAAIAASVAPQTEIIAINVFRGNFAWSSDIIAAIDWAIAHQADYNIVALNLSLGDSTKHTVPCNASWEQAAFKEAKAVSIVPVVASGNDSFPDGVSSPACALDAVSVGAVYDDDVGKKPWPVCKDNPDTTTKADQVTCFSNSATQLTLLAPGSVINAGGYAMSGTSQAAPHVAGAVAVLAAVDKEANGSYDPDQIVSVLVNTGKPIIDSKNGLSKPRIDVLAAVEAVQRIES